MAVAGFAFLTPSAQALISRRTDPEQQGEILGVNQSASAMARILGAVFGLTLYMPRRPPAALPGRRRADAGDAAADSAFGVEDMRGGEPARATTPKTASPGDASATARWV